MFDYQQPDPRGHFGIYGGSFISETDPRHQRAKSAYAKYQYDPNSSPNSKTSWRTLSAARHPSTTLRA
jgi:tryptophan synthase beta subunit